VTLAPTPASQIAAVCDVARRAGTEILAVYASGSFTATAKADASPLTEADLRAHRAILDGLREMDPSIPVLSEEGASVPLEVRRAWSRCWLVDPLDGTKEFLSRNGEFTVNIALVEQGAAMFGVVYVPVTGVTFWGGARLGAWRLAPDQTGADALQVMSPAPARVRVAGSRSHRGDSLDAFLERIGPHEFVSMGSSLKFCLIAEGRADVYPRLGPTSVWDTAAAQAVLEGAGGRVVTLDGEPLRYDARPELLNPHFVAMGSRTRDWLALLR
jgi:3'(2'), 5'-bisphosphate nucleotidase